MNNNEVAHLWANQSRESAKGSSFYFEGDTVYSYGRHFPIARIIHHPKTGERCVLFTTRDYSRTTQKHKSLVLSACCHLPRFHVDDVQQIVATVKTLNELVKGAQTAALQRAAAQRVERNHQARLKRANVKAEKESREAFPAELIAWRAGGPLPRMISRNGYSGQFHAGTALRLVDGGKYIETTRGAKVPASVARKAWPTLSAAVQKEQATPSAFAWTPFFALPEFTWGDYTGLSLRRVALGSPVELVVGCHQIPWAEVELMAQALGLTQVSAEVAS